jgi:hypothetical protein
MYEVRIFNSKEVTIHSLPEKKNGFLATYPSLLSHRMETVRESNGRPWRVTVCVPSKEGIAREWRCLQNKGPYNSDSSIDIIGDMIQVGRIAHLGRKSMHIKF